MYNDRIFSCYNRRSGGGGEKEEEQQQQQEVEEEDAACDDDEYEIREVCTWALRIAAASLTMSSTLTGAFSRSMILMATIESFARHLARHTVAEKPCRGAVQKRGVGGERGRGGTRRRREEEERRDA